MAFYALPTLTEDTFYTYITGNYSGSYNVNKAFSIMGYQLPLIMIKAGQFKEIEPFTNLYDGSLAISVITQIDNVADPLTAHDNTVAAMYDLMANSAMVYSGVNIPSGSFHLHGYYNSAYDQERSDRALMSILSYDIKAQTLGL